MSKSASCAEGARKLFTFLIDHDAFIEWADFAGIDVVPREHVNGDGRVVRQQRLHPSARLCPTFPVRFARSLDKILQPIRAHQARPRRLHPREDHLRIRQHDHAGQLGNGLDTRGGQDVLRDGEMAPVLFNRAEHPLALDVSTRAAPNAVPGAVLVDMHAIRQRLALEDHETGGYGDDVIDLSRTSIELQPQMVGDHHVLCVSKPKFQLVGDGLFAASAAQHLLQICFHLLSFGMIDRQLIEQLLQAVDGACIRLGNGDDHDRRELPS
nr:hypothetical protein [Alicyclobacillus macrosporangiidus]